MIGQILMNLLFGASLVSAGAYFSSWKSKSDEQKELFEKIGRTMLVAIFFGMLAASAMSLVNIFTHDFRYTYVWSYSSAELPKPFLFASFYSGQEGSFLLWTLFVSAIGVALLPYVRKHQYEREVMAFYALILVFLLLKLITKSPFAYVWETFAADGVVEGFKPANGRGLNPLLHNLWITIHPPILFAGFAAMSVPFAFAMAALVKRDYKKWIDVALPWTLFATGILGLGIMLGGFWAYETLGWGGFWGWDPVENSSLIPWIVGVALVHTMLTQKKTGGLVKTNLTLSVTAYLLVLYSTFLTRSGVLGDTSVHSFVDPGYFAYVLLIAFIAVFGVLGYGMILYRSRDIAASRADFDTSSREFSISIGSAILMAAAIIVFIGTSWPLASELLGQPKKAIDIAFYNDIMVWIAVIMGVINGLSLLLRWKKSPSKELLRKVFVPLVVTVVLTGITIYSGVQSIALISLFASSIFAIVINSELSLKILRGRPTFAGAYISHFGFSLLLVGVVFLSRFSIVEHVRLPYNETKEMLGYKLSYIGREQIEKDLKDREKYRYYVKVTDNSGKETTVAPILYWSDFNKRQSAFLEPGIGWGIWRDLYIAPKSVDVEGKAPEMVLKRGVTVPFALDSSISITLRDFDVSDMRNPNRSPDKLRLGVFITLKTATQTIDTVLYSVFQMKTGGNTKEAINIPNTSYFLALEQARPNLQNREESQATIAIADAKNPETSPKEVFTIEISHKPFINFVWFGTIFMVTGFFISVGRRSGEILPPSSSEKTDVFHAKIPKSDPTVVS